MPTVTLSILLAALPVLSVALLRAAVVRHADASHRPESTLAGTRGWLFVTAMILGGAGGAVLALGLRTPDAVLRAMPVWAAAFWEFAVIAPAYEELGKGMLLLGLFAAGRVASRVDGLVLGLAAGAGFASFEALTAFIVAIANGDSEGWLRVVVLRVFFGSAVHAGAPAVMGFLLGMAGPWRSFWRGMLVACAAVGAGWSIHAAWNALMLLSDLSDSPWPAVAALLIPFGLLVLLGRRLHLDLRPVPPLPADNS